MTRGWPNNLDDREDAKHRNLAPLAYAAQEEYERERNSKPDPVLMRGNWERALRLGAFGLAFFVAGFFLGYDTGQKDHHAHQVRVRVAESAKCPPSTGIYNKDGDYLGNLKLDSEEISFRGPMITRLCTYKRER